MPAIVHYQPVSLTCGEAKSSTGFIYSLRLKGMTANGFPCNHTASGEGIVIKAIWGDVICEESTGNIIKNLQEEISVARKQIEWRGVRDRQLFTLFNALCVE